jgi:hypothetical protein
VRVLASIVFMLVLGACQTNSTRRSESNALRPAQALAAEQKEVAGEIPVQFLLTAAATDFHAQHRSHTLEFRNVQIGHEMNPAGKMQYILCGQFLPRQKSRLIGRLSRRSRHRVTNNGLELKLRASVSNRPLYEVRKNGRPRCRAVLIPYSDVTKNRIQRAALQDCLERS